jgi:hypothetical protein
MNKAADLLEAQAKQQAEIGELPEIQAMLLSENKALQAKLSAIEAQPVNELVKALNGAATSLETISRLAGKTHYVGDDGERVPTFMGEHSEVRGYAANRASVARTALANAEAAQPLTKERIYETRTIPCPRHRS